MSVNDLLKAVIIASANDACTLLGEYVSGSESAFVDLMNDRASELGLKDTHFENCTGLDDSSKNHYSSAYDLAVISCEVMKYDIIYDYSTVWLDSLRDGKTELNNTNKLVNTYEGITGLKTGTTSNAGFCISATASRDGLNLVSVVLGADTSEDRFSLAASLLDYGFANYRLESVTVDESSVTPVKINMGVIKALKPSYSSDTKILINKDIAELEYEYVIPESLEAPINKGSAIGEIIVKSGDNEITRLPLLSDCNVKRVDFKYIFKTLFRNI